MNLQPEECYLALMVSIFAEVPPERAFILLGVQRFDMKKSRSILSQEDIEDALKFRESNMTWREIGDMYGLPDYSVQKKVSRYLQRKHTLSQQEHAQN